MAGGLAAATALRRAGHRVTIYEQAHFAGEVGAAISCAANGTRWLDEWDVDISLGKTVVLEKLIRHEWKTGDVQGVYDLTDYEDQVGMGESGVVHSDMDRRLTEASAGVQFVPQG